MKILARGLRIALVLLLTSCSQGIEDRIVGKWVELKEKPSTIEFKVDGSLLIAGDIAIEGSWKVVDAKHIEMNIIMSGFKLTEVMTIEFVEDRIIATNSKGKSTESKRAE